jgi:outer membrane protein
MNLARTFFTLAALAVSSLAVAADLHEMLTRGLSNDATYAAARAEWRAAQEKLPQGFALLLPSASLSANTQINDRTQDFRPTTNEPGGRSESGRFNSNSLSVSVTQPLYRAQNKIQYDQAKVQVAQADAQLSAALQDLILRVSQTYFDILLAQDNVTFKGAEKAAISEQLEQAKRNFEVGTSTITDTHEAQARFDLVTAQEIAALNELESTKRALQQIIGELPPRIAPLGPRFAPTDPSPKSMESWVDLAIENSLQVQVQKAAEEFAGKEVERNRAAHHPTLDAVASYSDRGSGSGVNLQTNTGRDERTTVLGLQLAFPLYQGGAVNSRVREAISNLEKARQDLEAAKRTAALDTRQAFLGVTSGIAQVKALQSAVVSSQSQLDSTRLGQEVGVRTGVDVLNAQQQLFSARRDLAQARYDYILNRLRLSAATGRLSVEEIARVSQWLAR